MAEFTTEDNVRLKFQLNDTTLVPSALVVSSIADAHARLLRFLDPEFDAEAPEDALVMGETLLAGAHLLRSLAAQDAFEQKQVALAGQRIDAGKRFAALTTMAAFAEDMAWFLLEPYTKERPARTALAPCDTTAVLGEE